MATEPVKRSWQEIAKEQAAKRKAGFGATPNFGGKSGVKGPSAKAMKQRYWSPAELGTRIRLVPVSEDDPWFVYYQRWHKVGSMTVPVISNSQNGLLNVPDLVYHLACEKESDELLAKPMYAITVLLLEDFHKVEKTSQKGAKFAEYVRCMGRDSRGKVRCDHCTAGVPKVFGQQRYYSLSQWGRERLLEEIGKLPGRCAACATGELSLASYVCGGCKGTLVDLTTTVVTDEDKEFLSSGEALTCNLCGKDCVPEAVYECVIPDGTSFREGCANPKRIAPASIFDYDFTLRATKNAAGKLSDVAISSFSEKKVYALQGYMTRPMPLAGFLSYEPLVDQAAKLHIEIPFEDVAEAEDYLASYFAPKTPAGATQAERPEEADADAVDWAATQQ